MEKNQLILIYGMPSSGKYTMAKRLHEDGALLLDNHYFHDFVRPFIKAEEDEKDHYFQELGKLRTAFYDILRNFYPKKRLSRYVFTAVFVDGEEQNINDLMDLAKDIKADFIPIELNASSEILKKRCQTDNRRNRNKVSSPDVMEKILNKNNLIGFEHPNKLAIEVSELDENQTYNIILEHLSKF